MERIDFSLFVISQQRLKKRLMQTFLHIPHALGGIEQDWVIIVLFTCKLVIFWVHGKN